MCPLLLDICDHQNYVDNILQADHDDRVRCDMFCLRPLEHYD
jgi:hypothetical protein